MQLTPSYLNSIKFKFYDWYKSILYSLEKETSGERNINNRPETDFQMINGISLESNTTSMAFLH